MYNVPADFINEQKIWETLEANKQPDFARIKEVLTKASEMKGLNLDEVADFNQHQRSGNAFRII